MKSDGFGMVEALGKVHWGGLMLVKVPSIVEVGTLSACGYVFSLAVCAARLLVFTEPSSGFAG